jgi:hypothetical protein
MRRAQNPTVWSGGHHVADGVVPVVGPVRGPRIGRAVQRGARDLVLVHLGEVVQEVVHPPSRAARNGVREVPSCRGEEPTLVLSDVLDEDGVLHALEANSPANVVAVGAVLSHDGRTGEGRWSELA